MILLIGFSVLSMAISLKTFSQLEESWADSKATLEALSNQQNDIVALKSLISDGAVEELAGIEDLKVQINELKVAVKNREDEFSEMRVAYNDLKVSTQESIDKLQLSDQLMLKKFSLLNNQFQKYSEEKLSILNY